MAETERPPRSKGWLILLVVLIVAVSGAAWGIWRDETKKNTPSEEQLQLALDRLLPGLIERSPAHFWVYLSAEARDSSAALSYPKFFRANVIQVTRRSRPIAIVRVARGRDDRPIASGLGNIPIIIWRSDGRPINAEYTTTWVWGPLLPERQWQGTRGWALLRDEILIPDAGVGFRPFEP